MNYGNSGREFNKLEPRFRWRGTTYQFAAESWTTPSGAAVNSHGLPGAVDMNEAGQILFAGLPPVSATAWGQNLFVATPSLTAVPATEVIDVQWTTKAGTGVPPDAMRTDFAPATAGGFSADNLTFTASMQNADVSKQRSLAVTLTSAASAFQVGKPIAAAGGVGVIGSGSYTDKSRLGSLVATGGEYTVTDPTELGGFTVRLVDVAFKELQTGNVYVANGTVIVQ